MLILPRRTAGRARALLLTALAGAALGALITVMPLSDRADRARADTAPTAPPTAASTEAPDAAIAAPTSGPSVTPAPTAGYDPGDSAKLTLTARVSGGSASAGDWHLSATDASGATRLDGPSGSAAVTGAVVPTGSYGLAAQTDHAGARWTDYTSSWTCTTGGTLTGANVDLDAGADVDCTIELRYAPPHLTLRLELVGGSTHVTDWTLAASGPMTISGASGSGAVTSAEVPSGAYRLSAVLGAGDMPPGYDARWTCTGANASSGVVQLAIGANASCVVTESWNRARLSLHARLTGPSGETARVATGPADANDFTLSASGPVVVTGRSGAQQEVPHGQYQLGESATVSRDDRYRLTGWACAGSGGIGVASTGQGVVDLAAGAAVDCTATLAWVGAPPASTPGTSPGTTSTPAAGAAEPSAGPSVTTSPIPVSSALPSDATASPAPSPTTTTGSEPSPSGSTTVGAARNSAEPTASRGTTVGTASPFARGLANLLGLLVITCALAAAYFVWDRRTRRH